MTDSGNAVACLYIQTREIGDDWIEKVPLLHFILNIHSFIGSFYAYIFVDGQKRKDLRSVDNIILYFPNGPKIYVYVYIIHKKTILSHFKKKGCGAISKKDN